MSAGIAEIKAALRQQLRAAALQHAAAERQAGSRAICERVQEHKIWREAETVLLYMPVEGEPDVQSLVRAGLAAGKAIVLPRYLAATGVYQACRISAAEADLLPGRYDVPEPGAHCPVVELNKLDLALAPGVGFAVNGCRLGRGKGYFDRMLSAVRGWKCGVAFDWQVIGEIPAAQHDIRVDSIVTPTRWHVVAPAAAT